MKRIALLVLVAVLLVAGDSSVTYVPSTQTDVVTRTVRLNKLYLANVTGGAVTVLIKDRATNCNNANCQLWPTISIAANTVYTAEFGGLPAASGVSWQASAANSVVGYISWQ